MHKVVARILHPFQAVLGFHTLEQRRLHGLNPRALAYIELVAESHQCDPVAFVNQPCA